MLQPCLISSRAKNEGGYPKLDRATYGHVFEHRYVYSQTHDNYVFKPGEKVMHICDNPGCIEPTHLKLGTQGDNIRDCYAKGRRSAKGTNNANAKLTEKEINRIREMSQLGYIGREIALEFHISVPTVNRVIREGTNGTS